MAKSEQVDEELVKKLKFLKILNLISYVSVFGAAAIFYSAKFMSNGDMSSSSIFALTALVAMSLVSGGYVQYTLKRLVSEPSLLAASKIAGFEKRVSKIVSEAPQSVAARGAAPISQPKVNRQSREPKKQAPSASFTSLNALSISRPASEEESDSES